MCVCGSPFFTLSQKEILQCCHGNRAHTEPERAGVDGLIWPRWFSELKLHPAHSVETGASLPVTDFPAVALAHVTHFTDTPFQIPFAIFFTCMMNSFRLLSAVFPPARSKCCTDSKFRMMTCRLYSCLTWHCLSLQGKCEEASTLLPLPVSRSTCLL